MPILKKKPSKKFIRGVIVFAVSALLLQTALLFLMTPGGLAMIYPYVLYMESEEINTSDTGVGEYFTLAEEVEDAGLVVLGADLFVGDSYSLASDYLKFLDRFADVSAVALYEQNIRMISISSAVVEGDYTAFTEACDRQRETKILSDQIYSLAGDVYTLNSRLGDDDKISIVGVKGYDSLDDVISYLSGDLYISPGGASGEHLEVLDATTNEEYVRLFKKHEETLKEILQGRFDTHADRCMMVEKNAIEEYSVIRNLERFAPAEGGTVYAVLPEHLLAEDSVFMKEAEKIYGKVLVTDTVYYDCTTLKDKVETERNDGSFPGVFEGIRIAEAEDLKGFRDYYTKAVNSFDSDRLSYRMNVIGDAGKRTVFLICGSGPVTFGADEKEETGTVGTVNVAPG